MLNYSQQWSIMCSITSCCYPSHGILHAQSIHYMHKRLGLVAATAAVIAASQLLPCRHDWRVHSQQWLSIPSSIEFLILFCCTIFQRAAICVTSLQHSKEMLPAWRPCTVEEVQGKITSDDKASHVMAWPRKYNTKVRPRKGKWA